MASLRDASTTTTNNNTQNEGVWIGIDLGTSNSACAVWDATRGSPKWMRLPDIGIPELVSTNTTKWGRLVPSVVQLPFGTSSPPLVGAQALRGSTTSSSTTTGTLISSVKRLLGRRLADLDSHWIESLPYEVIEDEQGELQLVVETCASDTPTTTTTTTMMMVTPVQVLAMILKSMREMAEVYLKKYATKKHLVIPGSAAGSAAGSLPDEFAIRHATIGVPAHFSNRQIALVKEAARCAGLVIVHTCLESTAAAMAYGLALQETSEDANIMVMDMGGGTSDISVACKTKKIQNNSLLLPAHGDREDDHMVSSAASYQILVTTGEERLGGDDIDQALVDYCMENMLKEDPAQSLPLPSTTSRRVMASKLLPLCRTAKENLCHLESPSRSETIRIDYDTKCLQVEIDQNQFAIILKPWLDKARGLIRRAMEQFKDVSPAKTISEVILVGGSTRIPAIRQMLQKEFFPDIEIGTSLNPMSSVAQGLAIHAALVSRLVPTHQLRSALMLDCIPHAIGVLVGRGDKDDGGNFIEILKRNAPLPAKGSTTFTLADKFQPGVTIQAVEKVGIMDQNGNPVYEDIGKEPFTFLLRRLSKDELAEMTHRSIEVGMKIDKDGQFIVSIFDDRDPEQVRKRQRFETQGQAVGVRPMDLGSIFGILWEDSNFSPGEQFLLVGLLVVTLVMYIVTKLAFNEDLIVVPEA